MSGKYGDFHPKLTGSLVKSFKAAREPEDHTEKSSSTDALAPRPQRAPRPGGALGEMANQVDRKVFADRLRAEEGRLDAKNIERNKKLTNNISSASGARSKLKDDDKISR
ncbi:hypothetical protein [Parvularcula sp. LCG005]|uniref:hypothetical protein n=1 Tax=Parvularcula sp. LCG005 TaxID=3078805 RepID=UPI00294221AC|nr:hypothetical protein [Parvularcula sp. LCG005]WOI52582.1 hypothetical protein RUI03_10530 [Parvularcula sp. LCG005]